MPISLSGTSTRSFIVETAALSQQHSRLLMQQPHSQLQILKQTSITFKTSTAGILKRRQTQSRHYLLDINSPLSDDDIVRTLEKARFVRYAEPLYPVRIFETPNDPYFHLQNYFHSTRLNSIFQAPTGTPVTVAVIDTGIDFRHIDLDGSFVHDEHGIKTFNFLGFSQGNTSQPAIDYHGHGTHIAGTIAAQLNNKTGIVPINPQAKLLTIRCLDAFGMGNQIDAAQAIYCAVDQGAKVINCSWGFHKKNTVLEEAVEYARQHGVIVIAAAGNSNTDLKEYPAAFDSVIAVGSVGLNNNRSSFSSFGSHLDFMTIGESLFSTVLNDHYAYKSGTSQSAAILTGVVSKLLSIQSHLTIDEIYSHLKRASSLNGQKTYKMGFGVLDFETLMAPFLESNEGDSASAAPSVLEERESLRLERVLNFPNPVQSGQTTFGFETNLNSNYRIRVFDLNGRLKKSLEGNASSGYNRVDWVLDDIENGTYIYIVDLSQSSRSVQKQGLLSILK